MAEYAAYANVDQLKTDLQISDTVDDAVLLRNLEEASRAIEQHLQRKFYMFTQTRYFTAKRSGDILVDDLLSVTTLKTDDDGDRTYEDTWTATDYDLYPYNEFPKWAIQVTPDGDYSFPGTAKGIEIAGVWGYGDGFSATPYEASSATITTNSTTATSVTVSDQSLVRVGQLWLVDTEWIYCTGLTEGSTDTATVKRGVNGSTGATHTTAAANIHLWPPLLTKVTLQVAHRFYRERESVTGQIGNSEIGTQQIRLLTMAELQLLAPLRKITFR